MQAIPPPQSFLETSPLMSSDNRKVPADPSTGQSPVTVSESESGAAAVSVVGGATAAASTTTSQPAAEEGSSIIVAIDERGNGSQICSTQIAEPGPLFHGTTTDTISHPKKVDNSSRTQSAPIPTIATSNAAVITTPRPKELDDAAPIVPGPVRNTSGEAPNLAGLDEHHSQQQIQQQQSAPLLISSIAPVATTTASPPKDVVDAASRASIQLQVDQNLVNTQMDRSSADETPAVTTSVQPTETPPPESQPHQQEVHQTPSNQNGMASDLQRQPQNQPSASIAPQPQVAEDYQTPNVATFPVDSSAQDGTSDTGTLYDMDAPSNQQLHSGEVPEQSSLPQPETTQQPQQQQHVVQSSEQLAQSQAYLPLQAGDQVIGMVGAIPILKIQGGGLHYVKEKKGRFNLLQESPTVATVNGPAPASHVSSMDNPQNQPISQTVTATSIASIPNPSRSSSPPSSSSSAVFQPNTVPAPQTFDGKSAPTVKKKGRFVVTNVKDPGSIPGLQNQTKSPSAVESIGQQQQQQQQQPQTVHQQHAEGPQAVQSDTTHQDLPHQQHPQIQSQQHHTIHEAPQNFPVAQFPIQPVMIQPITTMYPTYDNLAQQQPQLPQQQQQQQRHHTHLPQDQGHIIYQQAFAHSDDQQTQQFAPVPIQQSHDFSQQFSTVGPAQIQQVSGPALTVSYSQPLPHQQQQQQQQQWQLVQPPTPQYQQTYMSTAQESLPSAGHFVAQQLYSPTEAMLPTASYAPPTIPHSNSMPTPPATPGGVRQTTTGSNPDISPLRQTTSSASLPNALLPKAPIPNHASGIVDKNQLKGAPTKKLSTQLRTAKVPQTIDSSGTWSSVGLGKAFYYMDQMKAEVTEADRCIKTLQTDMKLLRDKNKELEARNKELERKLREEKVLREKADARIIDLRKKLHEVQGEVNLAKETSLDETGFRGPRAEPSVEKGNAGSYPVEEVKPSTPITTPITPRPAVRTSSDSVPSPANQNSQTISSEVAKVTASTKIQHGVSATSMGGLVAPGANIVTQVVEQIEKREPTMAQSIRLPGSGTETTVVLNASNPPTPANPKAHPQRVNDRQLPPVPVAPVPPLRQAAKGASNGHKHTQSMNDFDPLRNTVTTEMYLKNDTMVPVVSIPTSVTLEANPINTAPSFGSVPLVAEVDESFKSQNHFIIPAAFGATPAVTESSVGSEQHSSSFAMGQTSMVNGFHGLQQQQQQFIAAQQQPIMFQHVAGGIQPFSSSGQWVQGYMNQPVANSQGAMQQHLQATALGNQLQHQQQVQQQQQRVQHVNQPQVQQLQHHKHTKSAP